MKEKSKCESSYKAKLTELYDKVLKADNPNDQKPGISEIPK